jgi:hypothetical protein
VAGEEERKLKSYIRSNPNGTLIENPSVVLEPLIRTGTTASRSGSRKHADGATAKPPGCTDEFAGTRWPNPSEYCAEDPSPASAVNAYFATGENSFWNGIMVSETAGADSKGVVGVVELDSSTLNELHDVNPKPRLAVPPTIAKAIVDRC